ncbi:hypothetical protein P4475_13470 [Halalkalibacterium halodurans]|uniref:hypothetical protein n=1 Tax=Halalkalibacterium halodurans TaxID=86665 RepID=UPI002E1DFC73|nr:hypothetical protein [Halalkalibacterium halodurans]
MKVITLCGSTKFKRQFEQASAYLTLKGHVVLSVGFFEQSEGIEITEEQVQMFENIHRRKIEMSDEIFALDVDGYIGRSTRKEIEFATSKGMPIRYYSESELASTTFS